MLKQILIISALIFLAFAGITRAQTAEKDSVILPYPVDGWEKFDSLIVYPEIYKRAGVEGFYIIFIKVDTSGNASVIKTEPPDGPFEPKAREAVSKMKWIPAQKNGVSTSWIVKVPVLYLFNEEDRIQLRIRYGNRIMGKNIVNKD